MGDCMFWYGTVSTKSKIFKKRKTNKPLRKLFKAKIAFSLWYNNHCHPQIIFVEQLLNRISDHIRK